MEEILDEDRSQTLAELGKTLQVDESAVSKRLKVLGMNQKQGHWMPYELKPRNVERHFVSCELLLQRQKRKGFLHRIVTGDEKWIHYDNPRRIKSLSKPGHSSISSAKPNNHGSKHLLYIWWDQQAVIYYKLLKANETITRDCYRLLLMRLSRSLKEKRLLYAWRCDKVILLHDNGRPHVAKPVKTYLETLQWGILLTRRIHLNFQFAPIPFDGTWSSWPVLWFLRRT